MDIEIYNRWEKMLKLREELLAVDEDRMAGRKGYMLDELDVCRFVKHMLHRCQIIL